jgi:hypothetical protein
MQVSAELRWFWKDSLPPGADAWFRGGPFPPGGGRLRIDEYLADMTQTELGVKTRGGGRSVEIKGLVALGRDVPAPFAGRVQIWSKWISPRLTIDPLPRVALTKTRWVRKFDTAGDQAVEIALGGDERPLGAQPPPESGCQLELAVIDGAGHGRWHSIGFEAFGALKTVEQSLERTLTVLAGSAPSCETGLNLSYPEWLASVAAG